MSANTYGRQVVIPLTNKSGGSVAAGDVVVVDTTNNDAFTTDTSGGFTGGVGVAQETIANNAVGRVLVGGYAALVNVNASVTRGQYGKTHTVAKQATGTATRGSGTFCQWLTGGATPDAIVYPVDLLGSSLTDPTTTRGDIIVRGAAALARLAMAALGKVPTGNGTDVVAAYPPGYELDYQAISAPVTISATSEATATTIATSGSIALDGSTPVFVEVSFPRVSPAPAASLVVDLYVDSTIQGRIAVLTDNTGGSALAIPIHIKSPKLTPSNASHTFTVKCWRGGGNVDITVGAGGTGAYVNGFMRVVKG